MDSFTEREREGQLYREREREMVSYTESETQRQREFQAGDPAVSPLTEPTHIALFSTCKAQEEST